MGRAVIGPPIGFGDWSGFQERDRIGGSLEQVVDLPGVLEADDESIDGAQAEHVAQRSIFPFGRRDPTLAQNLHAHNSLARVVHLLEDR